MAVIQTRNLSKQFRTSFTLRKVAAVSNLNLEIDRGEIFGYLGPNGAGKTTTFKLLLGLIRPSAGHILLWDKEHRSVPQKSKIGFLPESPYFYNYLTAKEYLFFSGRLFGLSHRECTQKVQALFDLVGLADHQNKLIKHYSKGMLQRIGLAQALINDPELLILDEPMSGLDPLGRKEVRDIILHLKDKGKTIIFSTHILSDVETVCDRVGLLINGRLKDCGLLEDLLAPKIKSYEMCLKDLSQETLLYLDNMQIEVLQRGSESFFAVQEKHAHSVLAALLKKGGTLISFTARKEALEDIYLAEIRAGKNV
ncbi:MAG TPA: ABC transporter ATP-binding protein [Thermodesulfobacteriota bacterium]|nr:ABC transporter ATP-binding protein [Deltaproteobacteria bacterium]HNR13517.1 ABC transporter ATP-binding protein [Thermodesulfobacteriota bacterium]HNU70324.1 ABC transporter ATP-binding protein [Thermodesulfobacteriota bacterium]